MHKCDVCTKSFKFKYNMFLHMNSHNNGKTYYKSFKWHQSLPVHSEDASHKFKICHKVFSRKHYMSLHKNCHTDAIHQCGICTKAFITKAGLRIHYIVHTMKQQPFPCDICSKIFFRECKLQNHINKTHVEDHTKLNAEEDSIQCASVIQARKLIDGYQNQSTLEECGVVVKEENCAWG